jgi:murein DD-endopeptidase MepM/ murein hydrolase activator NlpD
VPKYEDAQTKRIRVLDKRPHHQEIAVKHQILPVIVGLLIAQSAAAADAEIRFYPQKQLWTYQLEAGRNLHSAVLQNVAVINLGDAALKVEQVRFELVRENDIVFSRTLYANDLAVAAAGGNALWKSGALDLLKFQFSPKQLLGAATSLSATTTLAAGEGLHLSAQVFAFPGRPELVKVTVDFDGDAKDVVAMLPLRYGFAPGNYRFPLHGRWVAGAGSTLHSHHRWAVPEEFAFDFVRYGASGGTYSGEGSKPADYYAYGEPVSAAADGEVVGAVNDLPDSIESLRRADEALEQYQQRLLQGQAALLAQGTQALAGNHVMLRHADGIYSLYAHLKPGSVVVAKGDRVKAGSKLGAVGTSGNSTEPHLHFHLCDAPDPLQCAGLPVTFDDIEIPFSERPRQIQSGDLIESIAPATAAPER